MIYHSHSAKETQQIAAQFAKQFVKSGGVVALIGDLGSGKTTFTQGFAKALGIKDRILSPTFVLIRQHQIPDTQRTLFHIDLYRLEGEIDPVSLGIQEMMDDKNNIVLIEWAEKILNQLPRNVQIIKFEKSGENDLQINLLLSD